VGWRLAEEVAWARPQRAGPEWWTLLDIAQDARDETRQSKCGQEYLMLRAKCSKATLYRRLETLAKAGLLIVAEHSAPGRRTLYEIPVLWTTAEQVASIVRPDHVSAIERPEQVSPAGNRSQNGPQQVSKSAEQVSPLLRPPPSYPRHYPRQLPNGSVADGPLEGSELSTAEPSGMTSIEKAAWQATESRTERMRAAQ